MITTARLNQGSHHRNRHNCNNSTWHSSGSLKWRFDFSTQLKNRTVPELEAAPSDDTSTTESTETAAMQEEEPPTTPVQQHNCAVSGSYES